MVLKTVSTDSAFRRRAQAHNSWNVRNGWMKSRAALAALAQSSNVVSGLGGLYSCLGKTYTVIHIYVYVDVYMYTYMCTNTDKCMKMHRYTYTYV